MPRQQRSISFWCTIVLAGLIAVATSILEVPVAAQEDNSVTIPLREYKNSGVSGTAGLEPIGNETYVTMELSGDPLIGNHPTHIHTGTCADFDPNPTYPLTTVILDDVNDMGVSETTVEDVRLRDLLDADYVILVHKSAEELTNYYVCGDIKISASVNETPPAGVGSANLTLVWPTLLGAIAVLAAVCSVALRFKRGSHG